MQATIHPMEPVGPYKYPFVQVFAQGWVDWLCEASGGRLEIELLGPDATFPGPEGLTAIGSRVVEACYSAPGWWIEQWPEWYVYGGLPGSWTTINQIFDGFFNYGLNEMLMQQAEERNLVAFPSLMTCHWNIQSSFPMPNPSSLEGKKIRAYGPWAAYAELFGAKPTTLAYGDLYMGMQLGTIDGLITSSQGLEAMKLKEVITDYVANVNAYNEVLLVNLDAFEALPEDLQGLILTESPYHLAVDGALYLQCEDYILARAVEEYGLTLWTWSDEDIAKITQDSVEKIWPELAQKSPGVAELIEIVKKQLKDHGRL